MTENFPPSSSLNAPIAGYPAEPVPPPVAGQSGTTQSSPAQSSTVDIAKDQASNVGQGASEAGQQVASVAKDQVQNVVSEAGNQAQDLLRQTRDELRDQAGAQQQRLAGGLRAIGDELHSMARNSEQPGVATDLARQAASKSHDLAGWLADREPGHLVDELKSFARQRPGAFLALAAGAGLLAGRLTRGVKDASSDTGGSSNGAGATGGSYPTASYPPVVEPASPYASRFGEAADYPVTGAGL